MSANATSASTQEQVTVLSARQKHLRVATIVPPFASLARVQDKISAFRTLKAIGVPQPQTFVLSSADDLGAVGTFPIFVKRPVSTASSGVRRATNAQELGTAAREFGLGQSELIAQSRRPDPLQWCKRSQTEAASRHIMPACACGKASVAERR